MFPAILNYVIYINIILNVKSLYFMLVSNLHSLHRLEADRYIILISVIVYCVVSFCLLVLFIFNFFIFSFFLTLVFFVILMPIMLILLL